MSITIPETGLYLVTWWTTANGLWLNGILTKTEADYTMGKDIAFFRQCTQGEELSAWNFSGQNFSDACGDMTALKIG